MIVYVLLTAILAVVVWIAYRLEVLMAQFDDIQALIAAINTETDTISAKIDKLIAGMGSGGLTPAQASTLKDQLQALSDRLGVLGQDPQEPIPPNP
jgi:hypothetical protein